MKNNHAKIYRILSNYGVPVLFPIICFVVLMVFLPEKITLRNVPYLLTQAIIPAVIAWGASFSMTIGNINFATGAFIVTSSIIGGNIALMFDLGIWGIILICPIVGAILGAITGGVFVLLKIPSLIVSIGFMLIFESVASLVFGGNGVFLPQNYVVFGNSVNTVYFGIATFIIAYFLTNYSLFGHHIRAIGSNATISRSVGLPVFRTRFLCFVIGGVFAGLYGALSLGSTSVQRPVNPMGSMKFVFDAIMCIYVGISIAPKINKIISIYIGSILIQMLQLALTAVSISSIFSQAIIAIVVLIAMTYSSRKVIVAKRAKHQLELMEAQRT